MKHTLFLMTGISLMTAFFVSADVSSKDTQSTGAKEGSKIRPAQIADVNTEEIRDGLTEFEKAKQLGDCIIAMAPSASMTITEKGVQSLDIHNPTPAETQKLFKKVRGLLTSGVDADLIRISGFKAPEKEKQGGLIWYSTGYPGKVVPKSEGGLSLVAYCELNNLVEACNLLSKYGVLADKSEILIKAAKDGNLESARFALVDNNDVDVRDANGQSALQIASIEGHTEIVRLLLKKGALVNLKSTDDDITALMITSQNGHMEIVELLLQKGADVNMKDKYGRTALWYAAWKGHTGVIKLLLEKGAVVDLKSSDYAVNALWTASQEGHAEVVKLLLEKGADVNMRDKDGMIALCYAAFEGHAEVVKLLLEKGAVVDLKSTDDGFTALMMASYQGHTEVVKILLENGADVNAKDKDSATALWFAALKGHTQVVRLLLEKKADVNVKTTTDGITALMVASQGGHTEVVKILLENGADINMRATIKNVERTALKMAKEMGHTDIVQLLEDAGAKE